MPEALELFGRFAALTRRMRRLGSTVLDLSYVASGRLDDCCERGIWAWDIAAGSLILEEAGGKVTDYRAGPLDLEGREIEASNGALHPVLVGITGGNRCWVWAARSLLSRAITSGRAALFAEARRRGFHRVRCGVNDRPRIGLLSASGYDHHRDPMGELGS